MNNQMNNTVNVWDPLIRIFHWSLVFFFFLAYITEDDWMTVHSYAGYTVALLVIFRLIWGLIGTRHARFADFMTSPSNAIVYVKQLFTGKARRYIGHNPAGAAMILLLLVSLSMTVISGMSLFATDGQGPLAGTFVSSWSEDALEEIHEFFVHFTLLLIITHVGGVLLSSLLHRENLVRSMVNGRKLQHVKPLDKGNSDVYQGEQQ